MRVVLDAIRGCRSGLTNMLTFPYGATLDEFGGRCVAGSSVG